MHQDDSRAARCSKAKAKAITREMLLDALRVALDLTQAQPVSALRVNRSAISKLERRTDMYVSALRGIIAAMGGR